MSTLLHDLRFAIRSLRRNGLLTAVMVTTLALGIGANAAIFSVVYGAILRPLPYGDGERLFRLRQDAPLADVEEAGVSVQEMADYRTRSRTLTGLVEYHSLWFSLLDRGEPERVQSGVVSWDFFDVMGVEPILGRTFTADEDRVGAPAVLVLGHDFWQSHFGGDPEVIGRTVEMNDHVHTIVGVLPPLPQYPDDNDVWMPWYACPFRSGGGWEENRTARALTVLGRLRPGVSLEDARRDVERVRGEMVAENPQSYPADGGFRASLLPLEEELTRDARPTFLILLGVSGFVLLIACANVANLTLARLWRREQELAVRAALGAGRGRIARQLLTESVVLAALGGALGVALAAGLVDVLAEFSARFTPRAREVRLDGAVLAFSAALALGTGLGVGLLPALTGRRDVAAALREGSGRASAGGRRSRLRSGLVVAQLAVTFTLLVGAGLMVRSFANLQAVDPGFDAGNVLTAQVDLDWAAYTEADERRRFWDALLARLRDLPGAEEVALANNFPLNGGTFSTPIRVEGQEVRPGEVLPGTDVLVVSPGYFAALRVPLLQGRALAESDHAGAPAVAVVNRSMAARRWGGESPIGRRISNDGEDWLTVVGVVGDVRQDGLDGEVRDQVFVPVAQSPLLAARLLLRTRQDPRRLTAALVEAVHAIDPRQPVAFVRTLEEVRSDSVASPRLTTLLLALFGVLALAISLAGILGLVTYTVTQRTREIGIRLALGAQAAEVRWLVVRQGLLVVGVGLLLGVGGAVAMSRLLGGLLFGVTPTDPGTYLAVAALFLAASAGASYLPARRATRISPLLALRSD